MSSVDLKQFLPYLAHCDLTEEQKLELLADLWSIIESFADEAWGLCPTQHYANDNTQLYGIKSLNNIESIHADNANEPLLLSPTDRSSRKR